MNSLLQNPPENNNSDAKISETKKRKRRNVKNVDSEQASTSTCYVSNHEVEQNIAMGLTDRLASFPPGFRFMPTDVELVRDYLLEKIGGQPLSHCLIHSVNIYNHHPVFLADNYMRYPHAEGWYFFTPRDRKYPNGKRPKRSCSDKGFWKATGSDSPVKTGDIEIGFKKSLVFYEGKHSSKNGKTNWIMHEYRAAVEPRAKTSESDMKLDDWVLCEIYYNSSSSKRKSKEEYLHDLPEEQFKEEYVHDLPEQQFNNDLEERVNNHLVELKNDLAEEQGNNNVLAVRGMTEQGNNNVLAAMAAMNMNNDMSNTNVEYDPHGPGRVLSDLNALTLNSTPPMKMEASNFDAGVVDTHAHLLIMPSSYFNNGCVLGAPPQRTQPFNYSGLEDLETDCHSMFDELPFNKDTDIDDFFEPDFDFGGNGDDQGSPKK